MAPIIGSQFFSVKSVHAATISTLIVFAVGFICRPIGGILFGHLGDRHGRVKALRYSIFTISLSTLLLGILPSYHIAGGTVSILFVVLRLLQGLSVGGEYSGVMIYLAESAPPDKCGLFSSFGAISANLGFLIATLMIALIKSLFSTTTLYEWAWRIPFVISGLFGFFIFYYRLQLLEPNVYVDLQKWRHLNRRPLLIALRHFPTMLLKILGLTCMGAPLYFVFFGYMPNYIEHYFSSPSKFNAFDLQAILLFVMLGLIPLAAIGGDRWGRKNMLLITALGMIFLVIPGFYLLNAKIFLASVIVLSVATLFSSIEQGNNLVSMVENCPVEVRYSAIAFAYNLGNALFGGTAPLIVSVLFQNRGYLAPAYYLTGMAMIGLMAILSLKVINPRELTRSKSNEILASEKSSSFSASSN